MKKDTKNKIAPAGIAIGIGVGTVFGVALHNPSLGLVFGVGIGLSIGVALGSSGNRRK